MLIEVAAAGAEDALVAVFFQMILVVHCTHSFPIAMR
jgi:hypothetical protein